MIWYYCKKWHNGEKAIERDKCEGCFNSVMFTKHRTRAYCIKEMEAKRIEIKEGEKNA